LVPIVIRTFEDSLVQNPVVNEPIVNEPSEIEENLKHDNVDVEEEPIPSQKPQEAVPLIRSTEREEARYLTIMLCSFKKINSRLA
jgi:hypothetical protein